MPAYELIFFLGVGGLVGLLSGMLGIGGGVVAVPLLVWIFNRNGFPPAYVVHMATATSLAVMSFSMSVSVWAHRMHVRESWPIVCRWIGPLFLGAVAGMVIVHYIQSAVLTLIFGIFLILLAVKTFISFESNTESEGPGHLPQKWAMRSAGLVMGTLASMLGIGGGALMLPYLSYYHVSMRRAIVVVAMGGCWVAITSTLLAIFLGWHQVGLPKNTIGYIYWPAWLGLIVGSVSCIPLGVSLAKRLPVRILQKIFAVILLLTGCDMVWSYVSFSSISAY